MPETKDDIARERDELKRENESLRRAQGASRPGVWQPTRFLLTEGDRQELEMFGVATIGGRRMTIDEVRDKVAGTDQADVQLNDPTPEMDRRDELVGPGATHPAGIRGFDFVYPSVGLARSIPRWPARLGSTGPPRTSTTSPRRTFRRLSAASREGLHP
jgi:hypothetical protein